MKFQSNPSPPSLSPREERPPPSPAPASPLAALIPTFLRRPSANATRSRSSSLVATRTTTSETSSITSPSSPPSTRVSSEDLGLLDDDPFACLVGSDAPIPTASVPPSPRTSPQRELFTFPTTPEHAMGQNSSAPRLPSLNLNVHPADGSPVPKPSEEPAVDILPLHRRDRSFTLKHHPRNWTWQSDRPAFRKRPSLPPLSILAQQNIVVVAPRSSRASQFPSEPWDLDELPNHPRAKSLSPTSKTRIPSPLTEARRVSTEQSNKELPPLPDLPPHPSPIAELEEEDETEQQTRDGHCIAPPSSPESFIQDLPVEEFSKGHTLSDGAGESSRLTLTASIAIAVSLVQESYQDVLEPVDIRPNAHLATSPAPSSCLLPSPNPHQLPELSPTSSGSRSSDDTDGDVPTTEEDGGFDSYQGNSFWRNDIERDFPLFSSVSLATPIPRRVRRGQDSNGSHVSGDYFFPTFHPSSDPNNVHFTPPRGKRSLSFSAGQTPSYERIIAMSAATARSYSSSQQNGNGTYSNYRGVPGSGGGQRDQDSRRPGDRDGYERRPGSNGGSGWGAGGGGDGRRGGEDSRQSWTRHAAAADEEESENNKQHHQFDSNSSVARSTTLRVPRPSMRSYGSGSSRASGGSTGLVPSVAPSLPSSPGAHLRNGSHQHSRSASGSAFRPRPTFASSSNARPQQPPDTSSPSSGSDDVPLAQRLPAALTAQKSIRKKAREDRDRRHTARKPSESISGVAPEELMSKLLLVQQSTSSAVPRGRTSPERYSQSREPRRSEDRTYQQMESYQMSGPGLHQGRSVRRPSPDQLPSEPRRRQPSLGPRNEPPAFPDVQTSRHPQTRGSFSRRHSPEAGAAVPRTPNTQFAFPPAGRTSPPVYDGGETIRPAMRSRAMTITQGAKSTVGDEQAVRRARSIREFKKSDEPQFAPPVPPSRGARSQPASRATSPVRYSGAMPALRGPAPGESHQQRIFVVDMQHFVDVDISKDMIAADLIGVVAARGDIQGRNWMVWEVNKEFGAERPIRDYERLSDVFASWTQEKLANALALRQTSLATTLSRQAMPIRPPYFAGYVNWATKPGKWSKRWLELRDNSLYLSKKENAKDSTFLCTVSSFDGYFYTRVVKSPKPFVFAVKSTDHISMFENASDALHTFSCEPEEGNAWMEKILLARSFFLYTQRAYLFRAASTIETSGADIQRRGTRRPVKPLLNDVSPALPPLPFQVSPNPNASTAAHVFTEGSLLSRSTGVPF